MADSRRIMFASTLQHSLAYPWLGMGDSTVPSSTRELDDIQCSICEANNGEKTNSTATAMTFDNGGIARNGCAPIANGSKHAAPATFKFAVNA